jgi:hypothetical protein
MRTTIISIFSLFLFNIGFAQSIPADSLKTNNDYPIKVKRLSPRVALLTGRLWHVNSLVIASNKGMVMVAAPFSKNITQCYKEAAEKEFNRKDFIYLINTGISIEDVGGNNAFKDKTIIGHVNFIKEIIKGKTNTLNKFDYLCLPNRIAMCKDQVDHLEKYRDSISNKSEKILYTAYFNTWKDLQNEYFINKEILPPNLTFTDEMSLDLGDITIQLINYGYKSSSSGLFVYIPEESILFTGQIVNKSALPSISFNKETPKNIVTNWISILNKFTNNKIELKYIISLNGGSDGIYNKEVLSEHYRYMKSLWEQMQQLKNEKKTLGEIKTTLKFETKFKEFGNLNNSVFPGTPWEILNIHENNIESFWLLLDK